MSFTNSLKVWGLSFFIYKWGTGADLNFTLSLLPLQPFSPEWQQTYLEHTPQQGVCSTGDAVQASGILRSRTREAGQIPAGMCFTACPGLPSIQQAAGGELGQWIFAQ
jgi:hypothetical protein